MLEGAGHVRDARVPEEHHDRGRAQPAADAGGTCVPPPLVVHPPPVVRRADLRVRGQVVEHMGTMDQPWHCPHGRPTMRHLSDIVGVGWDRAAFAVDWEAFGAGM